MHISNVCILVDRIVKFVMFHPTKILPKGSLLRLIMDRHHVSLLHLGLIKICFYFSVNMQTFIYFWVCVSRLQTWRIKLIFILRNVCD